MQAKLTFTATAPATAAPGASISLALTAKNDGKTAEVLRFRNGGRVDMQLIAGGGKVVFHWSKGMMFTMSLAAEKLEPGASKTWSITAQLPADLPRGAYTVRIWSMATGLETSSVKTVNVRVMP
ncbi:MAG: BsuPI-related putative proteinase inhibitor [Armatimonadaceae bacterium]